MLTRRPTGNGTAGKAEVSVSRRGGGDLSRRSLLRHAGVAAAAVPALGALGGSTLRRAEAQAYDPAAPIERKKTVCPFCAVGCSIWAEVQNGVWIGQEPVFESPINMGTHCAKGAATRDLVTGERRLKYPTKLENGRWTRISWDQAIEEIGDRVLQIREQDGPDSVYWLGSAKHSNEQAYLWRKFAAFWGTNNVDHQARICHSTTVAGVANTFGYGAMTNNFNDMHHAKMMLIIGANPAEAHPVAMQHVLTGKERGAKVIVVDPRFTRTARHADEFVRLRPGSDVAFMWGVLWHIFENGWEDTAFIENRLWGMDEVRAEVANWTPDETERVTGVPGEQVAEVARIMAENRPGTLVWCMGLTQSTIGNNKTRAATVLQSALGNMGVSGGGVNIFRGHDNVQGATDLGLLCHDLPGYYGLEEGAWKHWSRVWEVDYEWLQGRFATKELMETKGIPVSRWFDGVLEELQDLDQPQRIRAMVFNGHAPNSQTRGPDVKEGLTKLDLLVVIDPVATLTAVLGDRTDGTYLLPAGSTMEMAGSVTNSNRSLQWREKLVEPVFEAKSDYEITYLLARKLGFADELFKNIAIEDGEPVAEDLTREFNRGMWTVGYTGQSPERLKRHMEHQDKFDSETLLGMSGPVEGEYYGLPWPCWGPPEAGHPGTPLLYDESKSVAEGGLPFRARWGIEHDGQSLLASNTWTRGSEIEDGYPEVTYAMLERLGWAEDLTPAEMAAIRRVGGDEIGGVNWKTDLSGGLQRVAIAHGIAPFGNGRARMKVWSYPDPVPLHREPLYTSRRDLVDDYPTYEDRHDFRLPALYETIQEEDFTERFPFILTSGRLVEYEGGGDETRTNRWLAELQQRMFAEINVRDAERLGIAMDDMVWIHTPEGARIRVAAQITPRIGEGAVFLPFHFGGHFQGESLEERYPEGTVPWVLGEAANTAMTYGYDPVTFMQESKASLCRIERA